MCGEGKSKNEDCWVSYRNFTLFLLCFSPVHRQLTLIKHHTVRGRNITRSKENYCENIMLKFNISRCLHSSPSPSCSLDTVDFAGEEWRNKRRKKIFSVIFTTIFIFSRKPITLSAEWKGNHILANFLRSHFTFSTQRISSLFCAPVAVNPAALNSIDGHKRAAKVSDE